MKISMLIGKQILSQNGNTLGYVKAAYLSRNFQTLSSLVCVDKEEEEFYLPARAILALQDALIAGKSRLKTPSGIPFPVGISAYSHFGEWLGQVTDFSFDTPPAFLVQREEIQTVCPVECVSVGETLLLYSSPEAKNKGQHKKTRKAEERETPPSPEHSSIVPEENANALGRVNLLGRRVKLTLRDKFGRIIASEGERVTPDVISRARRENLLLRLAVNTLTNL